MLYPILQTAFEIFIAVLIVYSIYLIIRKLIAKL